MPYYRELGQARDNKFTRWCVKHFGLFMLLALVAMSSPIWVAAIIYYTWFVS